MPSKAIVSEIKVLACSIGWRNYHFLKITTEDGIVGWSEFDESFGSPAVSAVIGEIQHRVIGQSAMHHEHVSEDLRCVTRPGSGGVVGQALAAIENALLDVKAKALDVPCHVLLGGKVRDKICVYWSHCVGLPDAHRVVQSGDRRRQRRAPDRPRGWRTGLHGAEDQYLPL